MIFIIFQFQSGIDPMWVKTAIVCASLPVAANVFVLANYYKTFESESAAAITITTIVSSYCCYCVIQVYKSTCLPGDICLSNILTITLLDYMFQA